MPRVKVSKVLSNINFDKCLNDKEHSLLLNTFSDFEAHTPRFSLRTGCNNKNKKSIFKDLQKSIKNIEKEKINQQGEILTNKILGTTTSTRKEVESKMDEMDTIQSGGGRKRKHHSVDESHLKKRKYRKKNKKIIKRSFKKKTHKKRSVGHRHKKQNKQRRRKKTKKLSQKSSTIKRQKKHQYKHHNIFRNC